MIGKGAQRTYSDVELKKHVQFIEKYLKQNNWFCQDALSIADIQMSYPLQAMQARGWIKEDSPHLISFLQRIELRSAYQRALNRGGAYDLMFD